MVIFVGDISEDFLPEPHSILTKPAIVAYPSTNSAMWLQSRCISRSNVSNSLKSGTKHRRKHHLRHNRASTVIRKEERMLNQVSQIKHPNDVVDILTNYRNM